LLAEIAEFAVNIQMLYNEIHELYPFGEVNNPSGGQNYPAFMERKSSLLCF
jgi:hypothetical protein